MVNTTVNTKVLPWECLMLFDLVTSTKEMDVYVFIILWLEIVLNISRKYGWIRQSILAGFLDTKIKLER